MNACGLIVEYNPFHNGHKYHVQQAKKESSADCMIAVMSGSFLQRGEPAIMDKFHRTKAALASGIDIVLELPYVFAVQSSDLFAKGSVLTLNEIGVESICFGSESGDIHSFIQAYHEWNKNKQTYHTYLKKGLNAGKSFPSASKLAYEAIGLDSMDMDLTKPNNILGYSYVRTILDNQLAIKPLTIPRKDSNYHDTEIYGSIASATSIRTKYFRQHINIADLKHTMPAATLEELLNYQETATTLHQWENYFQILHYKVLTMSPNELARIHDVDEGIENRIRKTARLATSMHDWIDRIKTKRYTWTRIQRIFVHILTNTSKEEIDALTSTQSVPYVRILGLTEKGQKYLNKRKKRIEVPVYTKLSSHSHPMLAVEERASNAYYSTLPLPNKNALHKQEISGPIMVN